MIGSLLMTVIGLWMSALGAVCIEIEKPTIHMGDIQGPTV
jgi:hypothetical protein